MTETPKELVRWAHRLASLGLSPGSSGNVSARFGDRILISSTGSFLGTLETNELSVLDLNGTHLDGPGPSKEVPLHLAFYRRSTDIRAVVHLHAPHSVVRASMRPWSEASALPPISPYLVMQVGQVPLVRYHAPGSAELAAEITALTVRCNAVLLANHGLVCSGKSIAEACQRSLEVEESARILNIAGTLPLQIIGREQVAELSTKYRSPWDLESPEVWPSFTE
jgi:ribulose-5-phosphate 4-epimerase/fuculose-1-phosphate aldolase